MKTIKKASLIIFGFLFIITGLITIVVSALNDFTFLSRILGITGGVLLTLLGMYMMRKGSNSISDAVSWFSALFLPW
jgi:uncharacterized membrane protein